MPENPLEQKSKSKNLFLIIGAVVVLSIIAAVGLYFLTSEPEKTSNSQENENSSQTGSGEAVLSSLGGVNFGPYNPAAATSGDFIFSKDAATSEMIVFPFGQQICEQGSCKVLPELGFQGVKLGTKVTAVAPGKIVEVKEQGNNDYAVSTVFEGTSTAVNYDHLSNVTVKINDQVKASDVLGEVAPSGGQYGRYEIMLKEVASDNSATYLCPMDYLDSSVKDKLTADLKQFFTDWNTFMGKTVHDLTVMTPTGCLKSKLTESEVGS